MWRWASPSAPARYSPSLERLRDCDQAWGNETMHRDGPHAHLPHRGCSRSASYSSAVPLTAVAVSSLAACGNSSSGAPLPDAGGPIEPPAASCAAGPGGSETVMPPQVLASIADRYHEGWLASPAVADLDGDGTAEIVLARAGRLSVWHADETEQWQVDVDGRIWTSPVVGDLLPAEPGLEIAIASRGDIYLYNASGTLAPGYPFSWRDELRSLAAGDIDGDGRLELVAVTSDKLVEGNARDIIIAIEAEGGTIIDGFPPNTSGASGCDDACYVTGGYDQNVALGDVNGDGAADIFATQDNAYLSLHEGNGKAFPAASIFEGRNFFPGIRFLHDYALAKQGYADYESCGQPGPLHQLRTRHCRHRRRWSSGTRRARLGTKCVARR